MEVQGFRTTATFYSHCYALHIAQGFFTNPSWHTTSDDQNSMSVQRLILMLISSNQIQRPPNISSQHQINVKCSHLVSLYDDQNLTSYTGRTMQYQILTSLDIYIQLIVGCFKVTKIHHQPNVSSRLQIDIKYIQFSQLKMSLV